MKLDPSLVQPRRIALPALVCSLALLLSFHEVVSAAVRQGAVQRQTFQQLHRPAPCHGYKQVAELEACLNVVSLRP
jgi:hypothetical protein